MLSLGEVVVSNGGYIERIVNGAGSITISDGGMAERASIEYGIMNVLQNGNVTNTSVGSKGHFNVEYGGTATGITMDSSAVWSIGVNKYTNINMISGGTSIIASNGIYSGFSIQSWNHLSIGDGGKGDKLYIERQGYLTIENGGIASDITANHGIVYIKSNGILSGGSVDTNIHIYRGGSAISAKIGRYAEMTIDEGAMLQDVFISSGAYVNNFILKNGILIEDGLVISNVFVSKTGGSIYSGQTVISGSAISAGGVAIYSGGTLEDFNFNSGCHLSVEENGNLRNVFVKTGGYINGYQVKNDFSFIDEFIMSSVTISDGEYI